MSDTSVSVKNLRERVEADKRSILDSALNANVFGVIQSTSVNLNNQYSKLSDAEYASIFGDEDIDDSDEVFKQILEKAEEAFKHDKQFKKQYPHLKSIGNNLKISSRKTRNKKNKMVDDSIKIINTFRRNLIEADVEKGTVCKIDSINTKNKRKTIKRFSTSLKKEPTYSFHPTWKSTETHTPIKSTSTNLKQAKTKSSPHFNKMYTPNKIFNWVDDTMKNRANNSSSCKNTRSNIATCDSIINYENLTSPFKSKIDSSTPLRSTIVRFKPSPPEHFLYSNHENSSHSSDSLSIEENRSSSYISNDYKKNIPEHPKINEDYNESITYYPNEQYEYSKNIDGKYYFNHNDTSNETCGSILSSQIKQPFFEDFIRNLNNNISNNYNMEVKCSMKFKYFN